MGFWQVTSNKILYSFVTKVRDCSVVFFTEYSLPYHRSTVGHYASNCVTSVFYFILQVVCGVSNHVSLLWCSSVCVKNACVYRGSGL